MAGQKTKRTARRSKAKTADVVADPVSPNIDPRWQRHYERLSDLRSEFRRTKRRLKIEAAEFNAGIQREQADVATNSYDRDWALAQLSSDQNALFEIDEALSRIRNGTYGICELTGKRIPRERLEALPWTRFTAPVEAELEARGELAQNQPRLGARKRVPRENASTQDDAGAPA